MVRKSPLRASCGAPFLAVGFLGLGVCTALFAAAVGRWPALVLAWPAIDFLVLGADYAFGAPRLTFAKDPSTGRLALWSRLLMFPYLAVAAVLWHAMRWLSREPAHALLSPGIHIGRRLLRSEYPPGIRAVVDLTVELDEAMPPGTDHQYLNAPLLDGAAISPEALRALAGAIAALPRPLYLHCAAGHGRTSMVAAAVLLALGRARSPAEALEQIAACRPRARPKRLQREAVLALGAPP